MRMIDADAMIKELGISDRDIYCKCLIEEQPTAFDVEAVVEELEHLKCYESTDYAINKAIEIVKGGVK